MPAARRRSSIHSTSARATSAKLSVYSGCAPPAAPCSQSPGPRGDRPAADSPRRRRQIAVDLEVFDDVEAFGVSEQRADHARRQRIPGRILEMLPHVAASASNACPVLWLPSMEVSSQKPSPVAVVIGLRHVADVHRVVLAPADEELRVALRGRQQHLVQRRHGTVVQEGRRGPDARRGRGLYPANSCGRSSAPNPSRHCCVA